MKKKKLNIQIEEFDMVLCKNNSLDFKNIHEIIKKDEMGFNIADSSINGFTELWERPILVVIVGMFGNETINNTNYQVLKMMMKELTCVGFIGGVARQAYYIIGQHKNDMIILDPHDVNVSLNPLKNLTFLGSCTQHIRCFNLRSTQGCQARSIHEI